MCDALQDRGPQAFAMAPKKPGKGASVHEKGQSKTNPVGDGESETNPLVDALLNSYRACAKGRKMCTACFEPGQQRFGQEFCVLSLFDETMTSIGITIIGPSSLVFGKNSTCTVVHGTWEVNETFVNNII